MIIIPSCVLFGNYPLLDNYWANYFLMWKNLGSFQLYYPKLGFYCVALYLHNLLLGLLWFTFPILVNYWANYFLLWEKYGKVSVLLSQVGFLLCCPLFA